MALNCITHHTGKHTTVVVVLLFWYILYKGIGKLVSENSVQVTHMEQVHDDTTH